MSEHVYFDKYDVSGAYHWAECDRRYSNWKRYNPALDARYELTVQAIRRLGICGCLLDVGCGDGYLISLIAPHMQSVVGVDTDATAIRLARQQLRDHGNCDLIQTNGYDLPFAKASFDIVTSADVIEHLKEPMHHLKAICGMLKQNGALVLTTPKWRVDRKWDTRHEKEYRAEELRDLLGQFFRAVEITYFWRLKWSRFYATPIGWRLLKFLALSLHNPFLGGSESNPDQYGQILAICRRPQPSCNR